MPSAGGILSAGLCLYNNMLGNNTYTSINALKNEIHVHSTSNFISHLTENNLHYKEKPYNTLTVSTE